MGYEKKWIRKWYEEDEKEREFMGIEKNERVEGFVNIGKDENKMKERKREEMEKIVQEY